jgi:glutaredoxin-related protein
MMKTIPQVVIDDELIGGYAETEAMMKGLKSISKIGVTGVL